ncbi:hypothetical protein JW707_04160 [Candidatus Woesearchaeota archaeon]|nr:hypothetical protein [Candidatus Woesearchaeota archaeon]
MKKKEGRGKKQARRQADRELEKRVEEEQKKLLKKNPNSEKQKKAEKKDKELSDKVEPKKKEGKEESVHKKMDYQRFLEQQMVKLDYAAMFGYLGNLKKRVYEYSASENNVKTVYKKEETLARERILFYIDESKMDQIMGITRSWALSEEREAYKWWRVFNTNMAYLLFDLSMT